MGKFELAKKVSSKLGGAVSMSVCKEVMDAFLEVIVDETANTPVMLSEFGTFKQKINKPRVARNPITGASVNVPAKKRFSFKASYTLTKKLNS